MFTKTNNKETTYKPIPHQDYCNAYVDIDESEHFCKKNECFNAVLGKCIKMSSWNDFSICGCFEKNFKPCANTQVVENDVNYDNCNAFFFCAINYMIPLTCPGGFDFSASRSVCVLSDVADCFFVNN
jgi:hypothetical protein